MNKKEYKAPMLSVIEMNVSTSILAGSKGEATDAGSGIDDRIGEGNARQNYSGVWGDDED